MGQTPGSDYETTGLCDNCFSPEIAAVKGVGWEFAPKKIRCDVSGVTKCPGFHQDPNVSHFLEAVPGCHWQGGGPDWFVDVAFQNWNGLIYRTYIQVINNIDAGFYFVGYGPECGGTCVNDIEIGDCGDVLAGYGGTATFWWGPSITTL